MREFCCRWTSGRMRSRTNARASCASRSTSIMFSLIKSSSVSTIVTCPTFLSAVSTRRVNQVNPAQEHQPAANPLQNYRALGLLIPV